MRQPAPLWVSCATALAVAGCYAVTPTRSMHAAGPVAERPSRTEPPASRPTTGQGMVGRELTLDTTYRRSGRTITLRDRLDEIDHDLVRSIADMLAAASRCASTCVRVTGYLDGRGYVHGCDGSCSDPAFLAEVRGLLAAYVAATTDPERLYFVLRSIDPRLELRGNSFSRYDESSSSLPERDALVADTQARLVSVLLGPFECGPATIGGAIAVAYSVGPTPAERGVESAAWRAYVPTIAPLAARMFACASSLPGEDGAIGLELYAQRFPGARADEARTLERIRRRALALESIDAAVEYFQRYEPTAEDEPVRAVFAAAMLSQFPASPLPTEGRELRRREAALALYMSRFASDADVAARAGLYTRAVRRLEAAEERRERAADERARVARAEREAERRAEVAERRRAAADRREALRRWDGDPGLRARMRGTLDCMIACDAEGFDQGSCVTRCSE